MGKLEGGTVPFTPKKHTVVPLLKYKKNLKCGKREMSQTGGEMMKDDISVSKKLEIEADYLRKQNAFYYKKEIHSRMRMEQLEKKLQQKNKEIEEIKELQKKKLDECKEKAGFIVAEAIEKLKNSFLQQQSLQMLVDELQGHHLSQEVIDVAPNHGKPLVQYQCKESNNGDEAEVNMICQQIQVCFMVVNELEELIQNLSTTLQDKEICLQQLMSENMELKKSKDRMSNLEKKNAFHYKASIRHKHTVDSVLTTR